MRTYTYAERAEAVALAASIGPKKAALQLGYPVTTVVYWMHKPEHSEVIRAAEATIAERLKDAHARALASVMEGLADPKARLGDRAQALRILGEQLALAEGRATSRSENLNVNVDGLNYIEREEMRRYTEGLLARLDAGDIDGVEVAVTMALGMERKMRALVQDGTVPDVDAAHAMILRELDPLKELSGG